MESAPTALTFLEVGVLNKFACVIVCTSLLEHGPWVSAFVAARRKERAPYHTMSKELVTISVARRSCGAPYKLLFSKLRA